MFTCAKAVDNMLLFSWKQCSIFPIFYFRNNPNAALDLYSRKLFVGKQVFLRDDYRKMKNRVVN
jgi:hypothetical protein